ncbi:Mur ligase domain-containing protein [Candidatus Saccharibacteria bacterium]|nr:Mur ligase domain-containing protein [Candidatus Saccharibacteria bacterium]
MNPKNIYFIGIGGNAMGPLAEFAQDAGYSVFGSDRGANLMTEELSTRGINVHIGEQNGDFLSQVHSQTPIDWLIHSSAVPESHPELARARELGINNITKRSDLINFFIRAHNLQMIAIAGTHGKTTTTTMLTWAFHELDIPASHLIGAPITFGFSGKFDPNSNIFIYEADEYDRNFLAYSPATSIITTVDYDHADIYPTEDDYKAAFWEFCQKSGKVITWRSIAEKLKLQNPGVEYEKTSGGVTSMSSINQRLITLDGVDSRLKLAGEHNRENATLVLEYLRRESGRPEIELIPALNRFPSAKQRFERLADNLYTDYGHTPEEIAATLQMAREVARPDQNIVAVYMPHSNARQKEIVSRGGYSNTFDVASKIYWLPTLLARLSENENLLTPNDLINTLSEASKPNAEPAEPNETLIQKIKQHLSYGDFVIFFGTDDRWLRNSFLS